MSILLKYDRENAYPNKKILTSTQFLTYEKSPQQFYTEYVFGKKRQSSNAMNAGKIFSSLFADRSFDHIKACQELHVKPKRLAGVMGEAIKFLPELPKKNCEVALIAKVGKGWSIRATLDGYVPEFFDIIENKTGQVEWTQERVNFSDQLTFQALAHKLKFGVKPRKILLNWVDFRANPKRLVSNFKTSRSEKAMTILLNRIKVVIENIEAENWTNPIYTL